MLAGSPIFAQEALSQPTDLWLAAEFPDLTEHIGDDTALCLALSNIARPLARVPRSRSNISVWTGLLRCSRRS